MDSTVLWKLSYGLYSIGVMDGEIPQGCIANTVFQITAEDMLAVSIHRENYTHLLLEKTGRFSISILTEKTPVRVIGRLGFQSGAQVHKFEGLDYELYDGLPLLKANCAGHLICSVTSSADIETHTVFFARVTQALMDEPLPVLTYDYYYNVMRGKAPKKAPTYRGV